MDEGRTMKAFERIAFKTKQVSSVADYKELNTLRAKNRRDFRQGHECE